MQQNRLGCLTVTLFLALALSLFINFLFFVRGSASSVGMPGVRPLQKFGETLVVPPQGVNNEKIALIYLRGMISSAEPGSIGESMVEDLKLQFQQAAKDDNVKGIVLYVDSPGGEVTASDMIYQAVRKVRDQSKKPVVVYMGSLAASGGYYAACGGSYLMANETTLTGSIGVIMQTLNYRQLMDKVGVATVTFKSGKFKDLLSGSRDLTDEEKAYVQGMVMQTYDKFVGIVAKERKLDEQTLRNGIADGRVLSGKDALADKLIDGVGEVEDAYAKAMELAHAKGAAVVRYETHFGLSKLFKLLGQSEKAKIEVNLTESLAPKLQSGHLYYLPTFLAP
ncbi:signal peptide peptidase SppA [Verrucomicrobiota bacterium sgz303538]